MRKVLAGLSAALLVLSSAAAAEAFAPWETWPSGRLFPDDPRPEAEDPALRVCSFDLPVCVHAEVRTRPEDVLATLAEAENGYRALREEALLPPPMPDRGGGSPAFDLYLVAKGDAPLRIGFELPTSSPVDRAAAFAVLDRALAGCARRFAVHRALAVAMLAAIEGGEAGGTYASMGSYLAAMTTGCWSELDSAIDDAQAHPERASLHPSDAADPLASPLLPWYLDAGFGAAAPGGLLTAMFYADRQRTPDDATRFHNVPDFMTVLTRLAKGKEKALDDVLLDYAIARAFMGDREDGRHLVELASYGAIARPRFDASWPFTSLPRRVSFTPLEPTGSTYVWIDLAGAPRGAGLGLHFEWEEPVTMRWAAVRIGKDGEEVSRVVVLKEKGIRVAERNVLELDDLAGVLVVGVSAGEVGRDHPYRIDEAPYEPHGGTIYAIAQ